MSKSILIRLASIVMMLFVFCSICSAQNCVASGTPAWNAAIRNVIAGCAIDFGSPDGKWHLKFDSESRMTVESSDTHWNGPQLEPPAMVSWSPESNVFFINDGDGSGLSSSFRLFRILGTRVAEDDTIEHAAVSLFRERTHCASSSADPNVWGFGWSSNGSEIYLLIQPTVNESCGRPDQFISSVVRASDGKVLQTLSKAQTKVRFGASLPASLFGR